MSTIPIPQRFQGKLVYLEVMQPHHQEELRKAANHETIWKYLPMRLIGQKFDEWFNESLEQLHSNREIPFVMISTADQQIVGSTRYYDIVPQHRRIAIGNTWFGSTVWGSKVNAESMFLLLSHAFDSLNYQRVEFISDTINGETHSSLNNLGVSKEGVLRNHMICDDGRTRDSTIFSIIHREWPAMKQKVIAYLE